MATRAAGSSKSTTTGAVDEASVGPEPVRMAANGSVAIQADKQVRHTATVNEVLTNLTMFPQAAAQNTPDRRSIEGLR